MLNKLFGHFEKNGQEEFYTINTAYKFPLPKISKKFLRKLNRDSKYHLESDNIDISDIYNLLKDFSTNDRNLAVIAEKFTSFIYSLIEVNKLVSDFNSYFWMNFEGMMELVMTENPSYTMSVDIRTLENDPNSNPFNDKLLVNMFKGILKYSFRDRFATVMDRIFDCSYRVRSLETFLSFIQDKDILNIIELTDEFETFIENLRKNIPDYILYLEHMIEALTSYISIEAIFPVIQGLNYEFYLEHIPLYLSTIRYMISFWKENNNLDAFIIPNVINCFKESNVMVIYTRAHIIAVFLEFSNCLDVLSKLLQNPEFTALLSSEDLNLLGGILEEKDIIQNQIRLFIEKYLVMLNVIKNTFLENILLTDPTLHDAFLIEKVQRDKGLYPHIMMH